MKIMKVVDVPAEDLTEEDLVTLDRNKLIEVIRELQHKVNHAHDYTH